MIGVTFRRRQNRCKRKLVYHYLIKSNLSLSESGDVLHTSNLVWFLFNLFMQARTCNFFLQHWKIATFSDSSSEHLSEWFYFHLVYKDKGTIEVMRMFWNWFFIWILFLRFYKKKINKIQWDPYHDFFLSAVV